MSVVSLPIEETTRGLDALDKLKDFGLTLLQTAATTAVTQGINVGADALKEKLGPKPAQQIQVVQQATAPVNTANPTPEKAPATAPGTSSSPSTASGGGKGAIKAILIGGGVLVGVIVTAVVGYKVLAPTKKAA